MLLDPLLAVELKDVRRITVEHAQRIATRYERTAVNFLAMLKLARIQRCLRLLDP